MNSRYYSPEFGRFISPDNAIADVGGSPLGYNQFAYCFNNPINMSDQDGNWPSIGKILAAVAVVAVVTLVIAATAGGTMALLGASSAIVKGTMIGGAIGGFTAGGANIMISTTTYISQSTSQGNNISPYGLAVATTGGMLAGVMYHAPMVKYVSMSAGVQIVGYAESVIVLSP